MDSSNKRSEKNNNTSQNTASYNPWNLIFNTRNRTESETSVNSNPPNCQSGSQIGGFQRQTSKNEEYLWMICIASVWAGKQRRRSHHYDRHSTTTRRCANMDAKLQSLRLLSVLLALVVAEPAPGRVPKVYNALITSNQNLEPSKAYPVYQPVYQDIFSVQPSVIYGGHFPFASAGLLPLPVQSENNAPPAQPTPAASTPEPATEAPATEPPATSSEGAPEAPKDNNDPTTAPPPPNTESPIPLNQFGLPPQVVPLGRIDPGFGAFNPITYSYPSYSPYPGVRLYDPFDPFSLGPYGFPLYRPLPNILGPSSPFIPAQFPAPAAPAPADRPTQSDSQTPPPEPSDLNVLNYSSKDPAIPNVPPPPLPQGGLKSDKSK